MCVSLREVTHYITIPNIVYYKIKKQFSEIHELDLSKITEYKDYVFLPHIELSAIYDAFLDEYHLQKEKNNLHQTGNFEVEFRWYIDHTIKYDFYLARQYFRFEKNYLKPIGIDWCKKYKIKYIDDLVDY